MRLHKIQFPPVSERGLAQDESYFYLFRGEEKERIRLHDYSRIYQVPGLYEQVVYDRLKCQSPEMVTEVLRYTVFQAEARFSELRVLDLGAGNGMMGKELNKHGVARMIGVDIIPEAMIAAERDRPGNYDAYYVSDFTSLGAREREEFESWSLNCLTCVAALGFDDIPVKAFIEAFNILDEHSWLAFNIKETFLDRKDETGFSKLVRELIFSEFIDLCELRRYRHRYSLDGQPLFYYAIGGKKNGRVTPELLSEWEV